MYRHWNTWILAMALSAGGTSLASFAQNSPQSAPNETAEHAYKNVQVLNSIPANQLIPAMQFISSSLGAECAFCHVEGHFDSDEKKPKQTARKMIQMVTAINRDNFENQRQVTCSTCHHGQRLPVAIPEISEKPLAPPVPGIREDQSQPNFPGASELIAKYVKALGSREALLRLSSRTITATATFAGREFPATIYDKTPYKRAVIVHLPGGDNVTSFDGQHGWVQSPGRPPHDMPVSEIEGAKMDADLQFPLHLKEMFPALKPAPTLTIGNQDTYQLIAEDSRNQPRLRLYFDQQTGLLRRLIRYSDSPLGLNPARVDYEDYRPVDGVQVPFRMTFSRPSGQFTIQATRVDQGTVIDDAKFAKPAPTDEMSAPRKQ